jgi:hypothetical protein
VGDLLAKQLRLYFRLFTGYVRLYLRLCLGLYLRLSSPAGAAAQARLARWKGLASSMEI